MRKDIIFLVGIILLALSFIVILHDMLGYGIANAALGVFLSAIGTMFCSETGRIDAEEFQKNKPKKG